MDKGTKQFLLVGVLATDLALSGCSSVISPKVGAYGHDLSKVEQLLAVNQSTGDDARSLFGRPTIVGETMDGDKFYAFAFEGGNNVGNMVANTALSIASVGVFKNFNYEYTMKILYIKLDKNDKIIDIKKTGYAYIRYGSEYNRCDIRLTDAEVNSPASFGYREICKRYAEGISKKQGIPVAEVDTDKKLYSCNAACHASKGAMAVFGQLRYTTSDVKFKKLDFSRSEEGKLLKNLQQTASSPN
mgnify:CR=1 FL=1